jgi:hypothetical protein
MKWLKYKLFLILLSAIFGVGLTFIVSSASGADITTDPLVLQQTNRANWEPGGAYFPGAFQDRGSIITRGGNVTTTLTSNVNVGGWKLQSANILGQYTYTNDLTANHPHTVHSPFNVFNNASDSVSASGSGRQVTVDMSWNGAMVHPANGYDGPQGGGFPAPVGGIDLFTFDITGTASGSYLIPAQEQQQAENANERFNPLTDLTVPTNIDISPRVGGSSNSGSGIALTTDQTRQSGNDLTIQQNRNPTSYRLTELQRRYEESNENYRKALIKKMLFTGEISKEEHYNRNRFNEQVSYEVAKETWDGSVPAGLHQWGADGKENQKFVSSGGKHSENVFDSNGNLVTDPENMGTYNFFSPSGPSGLLHLRYDVNPYLKWGNSPEDTTTQQERLAKYQEETDKWIGLSPDNVISKNCDEYVRKSIDNMHGESLTSFAVCEVGIDRIGTPIVKVGNTVTQGIGEALRNTTEWTSNAGNTIVNGFQNINPRYLGTLGTGLSNF